MEKSDFIRDKCPCCNGLGVLLPDPSTPITNRCRQIQSRPANRNFNRDLKSVPHAGQRSNTKGEIKAGAGSFPAKLKNSREAQGAHPSHHRL